MALYKKHMSEEEAKEQEPSGFEKLEDGELKDVSGGYVSANPSKQCFEVIDDKTGEVLESGFKNHLAATRAAKLWDQSTQVISPDYGSRTCHSCLLGS